MQKIKEFNVRFVLTLKKLILGHFLSKIPSASQIESISPEKLHFGSILVQKLQNKVIPKRFILLILCPFWYFFCAHFGFFVVVPVTLCKKNQKRSMH